MTQYRTGTLVLVVILAIPSTRVESSPGFIRNDGQWPEEVSFLLRQGDADFWFTSEGVVVSEYHYCDIDRPYEVNTRSELDLEPVEPVERSVLRVRFLDASPDAVIAGESPLSEYHNYFLGDDPLQWRSYVPLYNCIRYRDLYPGIDVLYHIGVSGLKYDLTVAPGADPNRIIIEYRGADGLDVTSSGELRVEAGETVLVEGRPEAWQIRDGCREPVDISYRLLGSSTVMFDIGNHDPSLPLVIDPPLELLYGSYLGGSNRDFGTALVLAADGSILLCGSTRSSDFPTQNPYQSSFAGYSDAFISKFSPDGSQLLYSTYLGGASSDYSDGIDVSSDGTIYIAGDTYSEDFPVLNPIQEVQGGGDAFISVLSSGGDELLFSTYLGGSMTEHAGGITIDPSGLMFIVGDTDSPNFPLQDPFQATYTSPLDDAFITCISSEGDSLVYSTYMGGYGVDQAFDVIVDDEGYCYVTGRTSSSNFPVMNAYQESFAGTMDAFAVKLSPDGSEMLYGTYLGGSLWENGRAVGLHEGCLFIVGNTESMDFPVKYAFQEELAGGPSGDGFLTKLDPTGQELVYSTFYGGSLSDGLRGLWVDEGGSAFVTGFTLSPDLPLQNPFQGTLAGSDDCMVARFAPWGSELFWSTFLGGTDDEAGHDIEVDPAGNAHVVGTTYSADFPVQNPYQSELLGTSDVFFVTFGPEGTPVDPPYDAPVPSGASWSIRPNPFHSVLQIDLALGSGPFDLSVYDLTGRLIECLASGTMQAGEHTFVWEASEYSSGVYFIEARMESGVSSVEKVLLLR